MAIDDVISSYENAVSSGAYLDVRPASGDEWLMTHWDLLESSWQIHPHSDAGDIQIGFWGGMTGADTDLAKVGMHKLKFFLTYSEYVRLFNGTGATRQAGFSAIKTKD